MLPHASPAPDFARWLSRVARFRVSALALSGAEAQYVRSRSARNAPSTRHSLYALWKGTARARRRRSFGASRAPTCQPCPRLREVAFACSALARLCARSLWGRGPVRALPMRAQRAALATLALCTMEGHCTSETPPFLWRQPCSHMPARPLTSRGGFRV